MERVWSNTRRSRLPEEGSVEAGDQAEQLELKHNEHLHQTADRVRYQVGEAAALEHNPGTPSARLGRGTCGTCGPNRACGCRTRSCRTSRGGCGLKWFNREQTLSSKGRVDLLELWCVAVALPGADLRLMNHEYSVS